jgi:hypothetical protein
MTVALSNAERQARWRAKQNAAAKADPSIAAERDALKAEIAALKARHKRRRAAAATNFDRTNALRRHLSGSVRDFERSFKSWLASGPPDEAKTLLTQTLQISSEKLLRLTSKLRK